MSEVLVQIVEDGFIGGYLVGFVFEWGGSGEGEVSEIERGEGCCLVKRYVLSNGASLERILSWASSKGHGYFSARRMSARDRPIWV